MPLPGTTEWVPVIASRDSCVRVMGRDGKPLFEVPTASPPTAIRCAPGNRPATVDDASLPRPSVMLTTRHGQVCG
jgi:hypothetical protein